MGLFDSIGGLNSALFGGGGGGGGGFTNSQGTSSSYGQNSANSFVNQPQQNQLSNLYGYAGGLFNQFQGNPQSLIAGFTPTQQQGQQMALGSAGQLGNLANQGNQAYGNLLQSDPSQNPYFASALQASFNPFIQNFQNSILPGLRSDAVGVGQAGSSRAGIAQGLASQGLLQQLGNITANMGNNAFNQGQQNQLSALGQLPQLQQANLAPSNVYNTIGGQQQAMSQQYANAPFTLGSLYQSLLGAPTVLNQSQGTTSSQSQNTSNGVTNATNPTSQGGLMDLAPLAMMAFSDRRLKKDIKPIGRYKEYPVYEFSYLWDDIKHIGVMAQDVMLTNPDAVSIHHGYYAVNYAAL